MDKTNRTMQEEDNNNKRSRLPFERTNRQRQRQRTTADGH
jgi:hypothetical protein